MGETVYTTVRKLPKDVHKILRVEAAWQEISINQLIVNILTKEAKRLEKKRRG
jgi:predicted HicB family RNase H-like nuclease